jgi:hypothetical protein
MSHHHKKPRKNMEDPNLKREVDDVEKKLKDEYREVDGELESLEDRIEGIEHRGRKAISSTLTLGKGEPNMPLTVALGDKPGLAVYQEFDGLNGSGNKVGPSKVVAYSSDNGLVAGVDAVSGQLVYVGAGSCNISASDGGNLPASDVLTVTAGGTTGGAVSSTLTLTPGQ